MVFLSFAFDSLRGVANAFAAPIHTDWQRRRQASIVGTFRPNGARNLRLWQVILVWVLAMDLIMALWKL